jgi:outer membrane immunogenic protein
MKKFLLGSVGLAAIIMGGPALAADLRTPPPPPPPVAYYDWSGAYLGFNAGGIWYDVDRTFPNDLTGTANHTTSGSDGIFGFHAGAQWQWGAWVLGAEAALSGCFNECRTQSGILPVAAGFFPNNLSEHKITNLFTAGGRLGYAWDRWMIFGTGGWASADLKGTYCSAVTGICGPSFTGQNGASRNNGWYAGGGIDYMVHSGTLVDLILGVEYQHIDLDSKSAFCGNPSCTAASSFDLDGKADIVRARLTIKTKGYGWFY